MLTSHSILLTEGTAALHVTVQRRRSAGRSLYLNLQMISLQAYHCKTEVSRLRH